MKFNTVTKVETEILSLITKLDITTHVNVNLLSEKIFVSNILH